MTLRLLSTHTILFTRHGSVTDKSYVDEYGNVVAPTETSQIEAQGSLQPFTKMNIRVPLDEGFREEDYWIFCTKTDLRTTDQFDNLLPDTCTIDGKNYKVTRKGDWNGFNLRADHKEYWLQLIQPKGS